MANWCRLFGTDISNRYWQQTTQEEGEFRELVYDATGYNYQQWSDYRKQMNERGHFYVRGVNNKCLDPKPQPNLSNIILSGATPKSSSMC